MTQALLFGIHDREGRHIVPAGGWCLDTIALSENPAPTDYAALRADINWIVRANWGYGSTGTIPLPKDDNMYMDRLAHYTHNSVGAIRFIIGNEPNHEQERPDGVYITPERYADFFKRARTLIKTINSGYQVIVAACAPYHANPIDWLKYWRRVLELLGPNGCDGLSIHAYTRSSDPTDITSTAKMGPPLEGQSSGFYTYLDACVAVPTNMEHLPVYITEFNELLPEGWHDANTGVVQAAYADIDDTNGDSPEEQPIMCLILYRWPKYDKWYIEGKQGVIDDFQAAVAKGYQSPSVAQPATTQQEKVFMPKVSTGGDKSEVTVPSNPSSLPPREVDPRAEKRGTRILDARNLPPGQQYWRVKRLYTPDEAESDRLGPDRHVLANVLIGGERQVGVPLRVHWGNNNPDERATIHTKNNPNFAFSADHALTPGEFTIYVDDGKPSEIVAGIKMGAFGPDGKWNPGAHTSTLVEFELATVPAVTKPTEPTQPAQPPTVPPLAHPVADPRWRRVTQPYGPSSIDYSKYKVDGVPLKGHNGIDFGTPVGADIAAVDSGYVAESASDPDGYGEYVKIVHPWGESLYAHLSARKVSAGEGVNKGQVIGKSGNTGNSTGPHLHFGLRKNPYDRRDGWGGYIDPAPYLINSSAPLPDPASPAKAELIAITKRAAEEFDVDWRLLASLIQAESSYDPASFNKMSGARGLGNFMPATWAEWSAKVGASNILDATDNARATAAYLAWCIKTAGSPRKGLWAYNWGIGRLLEGKTPPAETLEYANKVLFGRDLLAIAGA